MVLNSKGGSGKSTVATSLASYYASQGKKVVLADCDPQASSLDWLAADPAVAATITGIDGSSGSFACRAAPTLSSTIPRPRCTARN